ncbi:MAG: ATP-binding protein [Flavobacteriaceae bacterium]|nr:ATP-binding protein [Flavobacteriaceae bacterium]
MQKKIVLIGGPGTGKSSVLNELENRGFHCMHEVSREVTLKAQQEGIQQLFLSDPLLFSRMLLDGRVKQYNDANTSKHTSIFFDRGIPDVYAYLEYTNDSYPKEFIDKSVHYKYDYAFMFKPWKEIYTSDNERYESFEESLIIDTFLQKTYADLGYRIIVVPFGSMKERTDFILNWLKTNA